MAIQIGKYKRPGIFIEEFDNSVIASPTVTGTTTFVAGFSRKGPINTPVLIQNINDFEKIFGSLDRNLERKGSFFHRTVSKMLESSSVYAMNLLSTDDTLDTIEYKSLSTATNHTNDVLREGAYRRFFDTSGFWKKDSESFNTLTKSNSGQADRLFAITNMSDKYVTAFIFKSRLTGFDRTILEWYGSADKVPAYLNQLDYASDYMVDVVVVGGDWSNYSELSVDSRWSTYFSNEGLRKDQVYDFANNRNVNLLAFYEGLSFIPYFRDSNGRNIFIETIINQDTDRTGLFCAFDADKLEEDFPNGMVDLIGNNLVINNQLVDTEQDSIEFLSYKETITEYLPFEATPLDIAGGVDGQNLVALGGTAMSANLRTAWGGDNRTAYYAESYINTLQFTTQSAYTGYTGSGATTSLQVGFVLSEANLGLGATSSPYAIIGGSSIALNSGVADTLTFSVLNTSFTAGSSTASYTSVVYINGSTGDLEIKNGTVKNVNPTISSIDLPLGYLSFTVGTDGFFDQVDSEPTWTNVYVDTDGYMELDPSSEFTVEDLGSGTIRVTFENTSDPALTTNYAQYRKIKLFNFLVNMLDSSNLSKMTMIKDVATLEKLSLEGATLVDFVTADTSNKSFDLNLGVSSVPTDILAGNLIFYRTDNEFVLGTKGFETRSLAGTASTGVVAKQSDFYASFYNGQVNTADWFYKNLTNKTLRVVFQDSNGDDYVVFDQTPFAGDIINKIINVPASSLNKSNFTILSAYDKTLLTDPISGASYSGAYEAYKISINTVAENLTGVTMISDTEVKVYLEMYLDSSANLITNFVDSSLSSSEVIDIDLNSTFRVNTAKSNYKQSIEFVEPSGYTPVANKILIDGTRYTEVKIGDFLEALVATASLATGQVGKRLTRVVSKRAYSGDTSLAEITCDASINKVTIHGDLQTMRYTSIENYVTTYKAIPLKGFRVREASMPDGTETRQSAILNLLAKGTSLFKALTNKEAIDFRYIIDSFGLGLTERSKQQLVDLCGSRLDCFGFINMPSLKSFKNSTSPSFVDAEGVLQSSYIASGGDPESNPAFLYTFGDGTGVTSVGYFLPYLTVDDNGRPFDVPPAMFAATTYMRKQNTAVTSITPWTIAAGVTNGRITNIAGVEKDFTLTDIENFNIAQMNPIVYKRNRGFIIETENTAQTLYKSALSYIHVREVLIELERQLSAMLLEFQWKFNTAEIRAEIKLRADVICETFVNKNGLYNYFNKCDEENNTPTIIDNQIGVLDTYVEPIKGMGIIVNNITILRTGAIQAGGFIIA